MSVTNQLGTQRFFLFLIRALLFTVPNTTLIQDKGGFQLLFSKGFKSKVSKY